MINKIDNMFFINNDKDEVIAKIMFEIEDNVLSITHTIVNKEYGGQGIGKKLVKEVVEYAKANNYQVDPICSFALKEFNDNIEYQRIMIKVEV